MQENDVATLTMSEAAPLIERHDLSPVALTEAVLERIDRYEDPLNSYITVTADEALDAAEKAAVEIAQGRYRGPLHGVPIALKDLCQTVGLRTTAGAKILREWIPAEDADLVTRLRLAGAIIMGKTNLHEFAYGVTTANPHFGPTTNPWDIERVPGGSSGGSAAAVSMRLCTAAIGSDTGGSIRLPSAFCGIVGLKPTYGLVSRRGCVPLSWSLDHMGPMTKSVRDAALLLQAIAGFDPGDPASSNLPTADFTAELEDGLNGLRLGVLREYADELVEPEIAAAFEEAISTLRELGASITDVVIPEMREAPTLSVTIMATEATNYHLQNLIARPEDFGEDVRIRLKMGASILGIDYVQAQRGRGLLIDAVNGALAGVDAVLTPSAPQSPMKIAEIPRSVGPGAATRFLLPFNVTGHPALSVPCGLTSEGLPIGMQIVGRHFEDSMVLRIGHRFEQATPFHSLTPPL